MSDSVQVNRRAFLTTVAATAAVVSLPVLQAQAARKKPVAPDQPIDIGKLADYPKDGVTDTWAKRGGDFFVVRKDGKLFAVSSICTHRFCLVQARDDEYYCACHKSHFTLDGEVTGGPAQTSLPHYGITLGDDGHVRVDATKEFSEAKWGDPASFVKV